MKRDLIRAAIAAVAIAAVCYGIAAARPPLAPRQAAPAAAGAAGDKVAGKVVMRVNGEAITEREFNVFMAQAPEQMQFVYSMPEGRRLLADEIVKLKTLEQEGIRRGVDKEEAVASRLEMNRTTLVAQSALRHIIGTPDEKRLRAAYEKDKGQFQSSDLGHILIAHEGSVVAPRTGKPLPLDQAVVKARRIVARLKAGASFADLAKSESDDLQSASNGGSLGPVDPASLPPQLRAATQNLQPGQISDPVRSEFGIHIFRAGEPHPQPFEAVRDALAARLQRDDAAAAIEKLQKSAKVELDPEFFPKPRERAAPQSPQKKPQS
jgi:peptidyl-prolyl cis-trans isomerase C